MFTLTKKTDYAIIALSHMARHPGQICTARDIAEKFHIPAALLMNVLKTLSQQEVVRSIRGAKGGYLLTVPAEKVTLEDIIQAIEGPIRFTQCMNEGGSDVPPCDLTAHCPVKRPAHKINEKLKEFLRNISLADIGGEEELGACVPLSVKGAAMKCQDGCGDAVTNVMQEGI